MAEYLIDTTQTMLDAFPGNHVLVDGDRIAAICPIWPTGTESAAETIQRTVNAHDHLVAALRKARGMAQSLLEADADAWGVPDPDYADMVKTIDDALATAEA